MPQRQSLRGPPPLRTSSSNSDPLHNRPRTSSLNSDPLHNRPITERSPKLGDRRSPRGAQADSVNQKKLGTRIADLEFQLGQAQRELGILKEQLTSAEVAKKEAQEELEEKAKKPIASEPVKIQENHHPPTEAQESKIMDSSAANEIPDDGQGETDVFEVPVEKVAVEPKVEFGQSTDQEELKAKQVSISIESQVNSEPEKPPFDELALKNDEINSLKSKLEDKEKELEVFCQENEGLKCRLCEAAIQKSSARTKEEEMTLRLNQLGQELETSKSSAVQLNEKLEAVETAKEALETEMKKLKVQTEQWRKAADAAAAVLAGDVEMNGRKISERCDSMDKQLGGVFDRQVGGYTGFAGSPGFGDAESDESFISGKRKGSGIRMFGDLWKKKGQK